MSTQTEPIKSETGRCPLPRYTHPSSAVYGLGFIGACIYYFSTATTFWIGVLGFLKAMVWPVFLVYGVLKALGM